MQVYILRHGEAEPRGPHVEEAERALTPRGHKDVRRVLQTVRTVIEPQKILTSPLRRARETADEAAAIFQVPAEETEHLLPDAVPAVLWKFLRQMEPHESVLLAGHEPHLSLFAAYLLHAPVSIDFKKGALLRIDCDADEAVPRGVLKWFLTPKIARA